MKMLKKTYIAAALTVACFSGAIHAQELTWDNANLHTVSLMMSEPMMKVDGSYHELLDSHYFKPMMTKDKVVMAPLDDIIDELNGVTKVEGKKIEFTLNGKTVVMKDGSSDATVNGKKVKAPAAAKLVDGAMYVPFKFVFEQFNGKYSWNSARNLAEVTLLRPEGTIFKAEKGNISLKTLGDQKDEWYGSAEAQTVADAMVKNQNADGGWFKIGSSNSLAQVYDRDTFPTYRQKSTIDNDATYTQIMTLAKVYQHTNKAEYKDAAIRGVEYLLDGQYKNGGWPQFFPNSTGYHRHVTFNDNAIANTLNVMRDVASQKNEFAFVSDKLAKRAQASMDKGLRLVLDSQVVSNGQKTGWCAQYNIDTLACERGRSYELASISGDESVNVIQFLMSIDNPSAEVVDSVNSAVSFLKSKEITGKKMIRTPDDTMEFGVNRVVIDQEGSSVWPRFINIENLQPLFSNRQGDKLDTFEEVSYERRVKYTWLVTTPNKMLKNEYPQWQEKYSPSVNALN